MHPALVKYTQQSMEEACNAISEFEANLGGTEIYSALSAIFSNLNSNGLMKKVFLLTDGCVNNPNSVVELVKANAENFTLHTFGIGDGVSTELITECARAGKGKHFFVTNYCDEFEGKFVDAT
mmetsp:Transcript_15738/g.18199  ORF Transcript_15738/g.18199 Transcript_15738/m.18199 type:complete len:123 (-) Transcript_15738:301-669(-)